MAVTALLAVSGCGGVLDPQGPVSAAQKTIFFNALTIMLAIIVPTSLATLAFAWWFRDSNRRARYRPDFVYSGGIELVIWGIPLLTITFLSGIIWIGTHSLDPPRAIRSGRQPITLQVVSIDWKWLFIYPEQGIATVNEIVVPAATPVRFALTSASVMNAFFVPQLGSMIYTMYGMVTQLNLEADRVGTYYGRSTMFSGDGFPGMQFTLRAVSDDDFSAWVRGIKGRKPALDRIGYDGLLQHKANMDPVSYGAVDPDLFSAIADGSLAPQPGPDSGKPGRDVKPTHGG